MMMARLRLLSVVWWLQVIGLAAVVFGAGWLGRFVTVPSGAPVSLWTGSGIALAGLLFFGNQLWPGAWLGSFLLEITTLKGSGAPAGGPLVLAGIVATGTVLQAVTGSWAIRRVLGKTPTLDTVNEVLALMGLGGFACAAIGATVSSLIPFAEQRALPTWSSWVSNWGPEVTGVLIFAPAALLLLEMKPRRFRWPGALRATEAAVLFVVIPVVVSQVGRGGDYGIILTTGSALWAALRFGKAGIGVNLFLMAMIVALNVRFESPLLGSIQTSQAESAADAQLLLGTFSITFWSLATLLNERERVARELRENEARFRQFSEGMSHVIWMMTPDKYHFLYVNQAFERIYGVSRKDLYDSSGLWLAAVHPEDRQRVADARWGRPGAGEYSEEYRVIRNDGVVRWVCETAVPLRNEQGEVVMFGGTVEDVTQSRQVAQELARHQAELLHVSRLSSIGEMVATLSHEIAQPMSAIGTYTTVCGGLLASDPETFDRLQILKKCIDSIAAENQRCRAILRRLRDYTRNAPRQRAPCDINSVLRESVELIVHELRRCDVRVRYQLAPSTAPVSGDRIQLQQVIINLLTNARDAMLQVDPRRRLVDLSSRMEGDFVAVEVADRGTGLEASQNGNIFEPFFTTKAQGMGIGLSICKTIVEEHGGEIHALSNEFGGATFRLVIPVGDKSAQGRGSAQETARERPDSNARDEPELLDDGSESGAAHGAVDPT